jgi:hypothetical protein
MERVLISVVIAMMLMLVSLSSVSAFGLQLPAATRLKTVNTNQQSMRYGAYRYSYILTSYRFLFVSVFCFPAQDGRRRDDHDVS